MSGPRTTRTQHDPPAHAHQNWDEVVWTNKKPAVSDFNENRPRPSRLEKEELPKEKVIARSLKDRIKSLRETLGLDQATLGRNLSIDSKLISQWEQGKGKPTPQQSNRLNRWMNKHRGLSNPCDAGQNL